MTIQEPYKGRGRGFASMTPEQRSEIARKGGQAAHRLGTAHTFTSEEASKAGAIGGARSRRRPAIKPQDEGQYGDIVSERLVQRGRIFQLENTATEQ